MSNAKISTLFTDKTQTTALFPRTKVNAISDNDGVGLDAILNAMIYADDSQETSVTTPVNADTLGGRPAQDFVNVGDLTNLIYADNMSTSIDAPLPISADNLGGVPANQYATKDYVAIEIGKAQMGGGSSGEGFDTSLLDNYALKSEVTSAINNIDFPVGSVNGKTGTIQLSASDVGAAPTSHGNHVPVTQTADNAKFLRNDNTWQTVTPANIGAAPAIADTTYPNCYYRMVNGVKEWINPPMAMYVEYCTTERYNGKQVYVKTVDLGKLPAANAKITVPYVSVTATPIRAFAVTSTRKMIPSVYYSASTNTRMEMHLSLENNTVSVYCTQDNSSVTGVATVWYIKE